MNFGGTQRVSGGFSATQDGFGSATQDKSKKAYGSQTLRAVSVRLINNVPDFDEAVVDGAPLHTVTILGRITSVSENPTRLSLVVHDGSGSIEVFRMKNDEDGADKEEYKVNQYVRIYGGLRSKGRGVTAFSLRHVTDFNEITYHGLQCIYQQCNLTKGPPSATSGTTNTPAASGAPVASSTKQESHVKGSLGGKNVREAITEVLRGTPDQGLIKSAVVAKLVPEGFTSFAVMESLNSMTNDGHLYTTIDDDHYQLAA